MLLNIFEFIQQFLKYVDQSFGLSPVQSELPEQDQPSEIWIQDDHSLEAAINQGRAAPKCPPPSLP
eukprot:5822205-Prorocentrum_lima.AAC.1